VIEKSALSEIEERKRTGVWTLADYTGGSKGKGHNAMGEKRGKRFFFFENRKERKTPKNSGGGKAPNPPNCLSANKSKQEKKKGSTNWGEKSWSQEGGKDNEKKKKPRN